ncbi:MAG: TIGR04283 family arsenosugar biosynthesis glycosyltransferase [Thainema sp.]
MISIILPCINEMRHGYLLSILDNLMAQVGEKEIIIALSPSDDGTREAILKYPDIQLIEAEANNRAQRFNIGIAASQGDIILLHHPATLLPAHTALQQIEQVLSDPAIAWGGFSHQFDLNHWLLRFTSWYSTYQRGQRGGILYFDHCVFVRREVLEKIGGVPDLDIFEDTAFSEALRQHGQPAIAPGNVITSARRFRDRGIYQHALLNQWLKLTYRLGINPRLLNRWYERNVQINVRYWK